MKNLRLNSRCDMLLGASSSAPISPLAPIVLSVRRARRERKEPPRGIKVYACVVSKRGLANRQAAFTLLEVIIASGLAATLMVLVWSLFSVYSKLNDRGARQATEMQLARSLMWQFRSDIHHARAAVATDRVDWAGSPTITGEASTDHWNDGIGETVPLPDRFHLLGSESTLHLVMGSYGRERMKRSTEQTYGGERVAPPVVFDVVQYTWKPRFLHLLHESQSPRDGVSQNSRLSSEPRTSGTGLVRRVVPWTRPKAAQKVDEGVQHSRSSEGSNDHQNTIVSYEPPSGEEIETEDAVPEVARFRLRYFDGSGWLSQWDSQIAGRFPQAIEIAFDLEQQDAIREKGRTSEELKIEQAENVEGYVEPGRQPEEPSDPDVVPPTEEFPYEYRFVVAVAATPHRRELSDVERDDG